MDPLPEAGRRGDWAQGAVRRATMMWVRKGKCTIMPSLSGVSPMCSVLYCTERVSAPCLVPLVVPWLPFGSPWCLSSPDGLLVLECDSYDVGPIPQPVSAYR